jgi:hypothetical protein
MKPQIAKSRDEYAKIRPRPTRNDYDQKAYLAFVEKTYLQQPKAAGKPNSTIPFPTLEYLLEVAKRAPRIKRGRPPIAPKMTLKAIVEDLGSERAELINQGRHANPRKLPTGDQIWGVTKRKALETGYSEGYLEDLRQHPSRLRQPRKRKSNKTQSTD